MSPSKEVITVGQAAKFSDLFTAKIRKSGLLSEPTQHVLENEGAEISDFFISEIARRVDARIRATEPHILQRQEFDPVKFLGKGWSIDEKVGQRAGNNLDAGKIVAKGYLKDGELYTSGEERLERIKAMLDDTQLDAQDFMALWNEKGHATLRWLYNTKGITFLSFWGTILRNLNDSRYVLFLYWNEGQWSWYCNWLDYDFGADNPSAVLASK